MRYGLQSNREKLPVDIEYEQRREANREILAQLTQRQDELVKQLSRAREPETYTIKDELSDTTHAINYLMGWPQPD